MTVPVSIKLSAPLPSGHRIGAWMRRAATRTLAEQWSGRRWRIVKTPTLPNSYQPDLMAVSCVTANDCVAVGGGSAEHSLITGPRPTPQYARREVRFAGGCYRGTSMRSTELPSGS